MHNFGRNTMEDLRKYTRRTELYKLSAEEQTEKMKLVIWTTYIDRKKIICFDKQKSTKNRMFSCFFNTLKF